MSSISSATSSAGLFYGPASPVQGPGQGVWTPEGHGQAPAHGVAAARPDWQDRQGLLGQAQARLDSLPPGAQRDQLQKSVDGYRRDTTAQEYARLNANVYTYDAPPAGWTNISSDRAKLAEIGLTPEQLSIPGTAFRAQVYAPDPAVLGADMKTTLVFRGSTSDGSDWSNNFRQGLNMDSAYYRQAVDIGNSLLRTGADVHVVGHSLGGGLASATAHASGLPATTFNAAGLHKQTVERYGGMADVPGHVEAWRVKGEILTVMQEQSLGSSLVALALGGPWGLGTKVAVSATMPDAVGETISISGKGNPFKRHGIAQVQTALEKQVERSEHALREQLRW